MTPDLFVLVAAGLGMLWLWVCAAERVYRLVLRLAAAVVKREGKDAAHRD